MQMPKSCHEIEAIGYQTEYPMKSIVNRICISVNCKVITWNNLLIEGENKLQTRIRLENVFYYVYFNIKEVVLMQGVGYKKTELKFKREQFCFVFN